MRGGLRETTRPTAGDNKNWQQGEGSLVIIEFDGMTEGSLVGGLEDWETIREEKEEQNNQTSAGSTIEQ